MANPDTRISDYARGKADAYADVIRQGMAVYKDERNDFQDRRAVRTFVDRFVVAAKIAEILD